MRFPSTTLPQTNDPKGNQKAIIDLLDKINRVAASIPGASGGGIKSVSADYTFTPGDGIFDLFVTTGGSTITVTLDKSSRNVGRALRVWKADAGTGEVKVVGMNVGGTVETISGYAAVYAGLQYQHADIYQDGTVNFNVGQYNQVVAGEPSWGNPHTHLVTIVNGYDPTVTTDITVDCSAEVPVGTKGVFGYCQVYSTTVARDLNIKDSSGNIWSSVRNITASVPGKTTFMVPLDTSRVFKYAVSDADVTSVSIFIRGYYI